MRPFPRTSSELRPIETPPLYLLPSELSARVERGGALGPAQAADGHEGVPVHHPGPEAEHARPFARDAHPAPERTVKAAREQQALRKQTSTRRGRRDQKGSVGGKGAFSVFARTRQAAQISKCKTNERRRVRASAPRRGCTWCRSKAKHRTPPDGRGLSSCAQAKNVAPGASAQR
jgi:hypothetical protein